MRRVMAAAAVGGALLLAGCSSAASSGATTSATAGSSSTGAGNANNAGGSVTVRLGFLTNITHAPALVGLKEGYFAQALGNAGTLKPTAFASGTQETTALLAGQLDAAYVGPNPTINAWQKSGGTAIKVISGAATGGASLVVKKGVTSAAQLKGQSLATPSLGNTQDVALRYWLKQNGLSTNTTGGGDVFVKPTTPNSAAVLEFQSGQIAGGSEPAPYDVQMVKDGGTVLLSETGVTTLLVVTQSFLAAHPAVVADLLKAQVQANDFIAKNAAAAQADVNTELASYTGKPLKPSIVAASFKEITFTDDPDQSSLTADATQATSLGLLKPVTLTGLFDLGPLNSALTAAGEQTVGS
ncbi:MAG TPA: ABC transporter substrate-binding protein [Streptosporangiaceae bacterium]|nr:ABC transporter substrate-binding protein [Streptosporangiaceae bacterium]